MCVVWLEKCIGNAKTFYIASFLFTSLGGLIDIGYVYQKYKRRKARISDSRDDAGRTEESESRNREERIDKASLSLKRGVLEDFPQFILMICYVTWQMNPDDDKTWIILKVVLSALSQVSLLYNVRQLEEDD